MRLKFRYNIVVLLLFVAVSAVVAHRLSPRLSPILSAWLPEQKAPIYKPPPLREWLLSKEVGFRKVRDDSARNGERTFWDWGPVKRDVKEGNVEWMVPLLGFYASEDPDENVRHRAIIALKHLATATRDVIPELEAALESENPTTAQWAYGALFEIGPEATPAYVRMLQHEDSKIRRWGADNMRRRGEASPEAIATMTAALEDTDPYIRSDAAFTLEMWDKRRKRQALAADDQNPTPRTVEEVLP